MQVYIYIYVVYNEQFLGQKVMNNLVKCILNFRIYINMKNVLKLL